MKKLMMCLCVGVLLWGPLTATMAQDEKGPVPSQMVRVPDVRGKLLSDAMRVIRDAGLRSETQVSDRDGQRRVVDRQEPAPGESVVRGSTVKIFGRLAP